MSFKSLSLYFSVTYPAQTTPMIIPIIFPKGCGRKYLSAKKPSMKQQKTRTTIFALNTKEYSRKAFVFILQSPPHG